MKHKRKNLNTASFKAIRTKKEAVTLLLILAWLSTQTILAAENSNEEKKIAHISKKLKPISDNQWNEIIGSKSAETYDIQKGDTLWSISQKLFGNSNYWPKMWTYNNTIKNPHIVNPGEKLVFIGGSSESTPTLTNESALTKQKTSSAEQNSPETLNTNNTKSTHEYDKISPDLWTPRRVIAEKLKANYDDYGIDKELKITIPSRFSFRIPSIANDTTVPFLGEVVGSRREGVGLAQNETVFLKSNSQDLQVGTTYSVFSEPEFIREKKSDRSGYIYKTVGEIKIVSVKDDLYVGVITKSYDIIKRGDRVYPLLPLISDIKPIAAQNAIEGLILTSSIQSTRNSSQFHFIHLDRGIEDGIQIGNVFRIYDYFDPKTKKKLTDSDFLINADAIVVHATAQFSTALVLRSIDTFSRGDFGVLLTDINDIEIQLIDRTKNLGEDSQSPESKAEDRELDELDELDRKNGEGLGKKEEQEIKELDHWDKSKDQPQENNNDPTKAESLDDETSTDKLEKEPSNQQPIENKQEVAPEHVEDPTLENQLQEPSVKPTEKPDQTLDTPQQIEAPQEIPEMQELPNTQTNKEDAILDSTPNVEPIQQALPDDMELKPQN